MKVLIIEDEPAAARRLQKLLTDFDEKIEILEQLDGIESSLIWLSERHNPKPDLIFMDIHLSDGSCFEIFKLIKIDSPIIFITAYDQYALDAFKVNAIDYLLKPIKEQDLQNALQKFEKFRPGGVLNYESLAKAIRQEQDNFQKRFLIRLGQSIKVVEIADVAYFYTQDKISFLATKSGKRYPMDYSLEKLEELSDPKKFFRINRQFIVNIEAISEMYAYSKSRVKLKLDPPTDSDTIVSTERSPHFKKWLSGDDDSKFEN